MQRISLLLLLSGCCWMLLLAAVQPVSRFSGEIVFGSGGGFTGKETVYVLSRDGKLTESSMGNPAQQVATWMPDQIHKAFKLAAKTDFKKPFHQPGNMYYFVGKQEKGTVTRITWGNDQEPPAAAKALYQYLMTQRQQSAEQ